jgi:hypothetical protein
MTDNEMTDIEQLAQMVDGDEWTVQCPWVEWGDCVKSPCANCDHTSRQR